MKRGTIRRTVAAAATAAAWWLAAALFVAFGAVRAAADDGAGRFPNVTLTTQDGVDVKFYDDLVKGKTVAITLIYTTCQYACPLETARMAQVQRLLGDRMGREIFFYSITIDPEHDTPAVLKEYAEKYHAGPGWLFLTGKQADIDLISKKIGLYSPPNPANPDGHLPYLLVGNEATGQWMRNSATDNPNFLARTIGDWLNSWRNTNKELKSFAEAPANLKLDQGRYTFATHCAACHTIGRGDGLAPDLLDVAKRREREWLMRFIMAPDRVRESGDPIAKELRAKYREVIMPRLNMGSADAELLIDYIDRQSRAVSDAAARVPEANATVAIASTATAVADLTPIVDPYLRIQRALNVDSLADLKSSARGIAAEATKLGAHGAAMQAAAGELERAADLTAARAAFGALGDALMIYAKDSGAAIGEDVKVAYCPMARKYWLQKGETIRNPYYGKEMSDCGRINATLPALTK